MTKKNFCDEKNWVNKIFVLLNFFLGLSNSNSDSDRYSDGSNSDRSNSDSSNSDWSNSD